MNGRSRHCRQSGRRRGWRKCGLGRKCCLKRRLTHFFTAASLTRCRTFSRIWFPATNSFFATSFSSSCSGCANDFRVQRTGRRLRRVTRLAKNSADKIHHNAACTAIERSFGSPATQATRQNFGFGFSSIGGCYALCQTVEWKSGGCGGRSPRSRFGTLCLTSRSYARISHYFTVANRRTLRHQTLHFPRLYHAYS